MEPAVQRSDRVRRPGRDPSQRSGGSSALPCPRPAARRGVKRDARRLATLYIPARTYGALDTYVAERLIGGSGPIRERYHDVAPDGGSGRTEIAWPVLWMAG